MVHRNGSSERHGASPSRRIPEATVARLPLYYRALLGLAEIEVPTVSSDELAMHAGVSAAKLRKDLSYLGSYGTRGVGYDVSFLLRQIGKELGLDQTWAVAIVGVGNLGSALANYRGFKERGFEVVALFDSAPEKVGTSIAGITVSHLDDLPEVCQQRGVQIGIIATPAQAAQYVAEKLIGAGVKSILNFAPVELRVPHDAVIRKVDVAVELQILAFYRQQDLSRRGIIERTPIETDGEGEHSGVDAALGAARRGDEG